MITLHSSPAPRALALALLAMALLAACGWWRQVASPAEPQYLRVAFLPLEDLSIPELNRDLGTAVAAMAEVRLEGSPQIYAFRAADRMEAIRRKADVMVSGYLARRGGSILAGLFCEDSRTLRLVWRKQVETAAANAAVAVAEAMVVNFDPDAPPFPDFLPGSLDLYLLAEKTADPAKKKAYLRQALQLEPRLVSASLLLARLQQARGEPQEARQTLQSALAASSRMSKTSAAWVAFELAGLDKNRQARREALLALAQASPSDGWVLRLLGEIDFQRRDFLSSRKWYREAIRRDPQDPLLWNSLGYTEALAGDLPAALKSFARYQALEPNSANPIDSAADAMFYCGAYLEASERYLEAFAREEAFLGGGTLMKSALARLLAGDVKEADRLYAQYTEERTMRGQFVSPLEHPQWDYIAGRRQKAHTAIASLAETPARPGFDPGLALAQLAFWRFQEGDAAEARRLAQRALGKAAGPAGQSLARVASILAAPPLSARQLNEALLRQFPAEGQKPLRRLVAAYTLVLHRQWGEAIPYLKEMLEDSSPLGPEPVAYLLGRALLETGRQAEIGNLLDGLPVNVLTGDPFFNALVVPGFPETRARWLQWQRNNGVARRLSRTESRSLPAGDAAADGKS